jgi:signal transduction histidine kinase
MTLGLPGHLAPHSESWAFARASHVIALVCLVAAEAVLIALQVGRAGVILWPAMLVLLPFLGVLWIVERYPSLLSSIAYLVVGAVSIYAFVLTATLQYPGEAVTNAFVFVVVKIALIVVGGVGTGVLPVIGWSTAGAVLSEAATLAAAAQTGARIELDATTLAVYLVVVVLLVIIGASRQRVRLAQPTLQLAVRDEHLSAMRQRIEVRADAMMHDTILGHLAAVALAPDGRLRPDLQARIERDLAVLVGEEWLVDEPPHDEEQLLWVTGAFHRTIEEVRGLGLVIDVSGDTSVLARLGTPARGALALAAKQCLVNVLEHAQTGIAELVVYGSATEVCVMVIDGGAGFSEEQSAGDRFGLRHSVRSRIGDVGGTVQVWSSPGNGTSVLMRVPVTP